MNFDLETSQQVVLVTGGGSGIGQATCLKFCEKGYKIICADINKQAAQETLELIKKNFSNQPQAISVFVDVCNEQSVQEMINKSIESFQRIDACVNCAGIIGPKNSLLDYNESDFDNVYNINCKGIFLCCKQEIKQMLNQKPRKSKFGSLNKGNIVNVAALAGLKSIPYFYGYSAAKAGVIGLTKSMAAEFSKDDIRINVIAPGSIETPMIKEQLQGQFQELKPMIIQTHKIGRLAQPEEIAEAIYFLCSDQCPFIIGDPLIISGGQFI